MLTAWLLVCFLIMPQFLALVIPIFNRPSITQQCWENSRFYFSYLEWFCTCVQDGYLKLHSKFTKITFKKQHDGQGQFIVMCYSLFPNGCEHNANTGKLCTMYMHLQGKVGEYKVFNILAVQDLQESMLVSSE